LNQNVKVRYLLDGRYFTAIGSSSLKSVVGYIVYIMHNV